MAAALAEKADGERAHESEDPEAGKGADSEKRGAGGAGETGLGHGVGHEGRAAQHREEPDYSGDDGDHRGDDPGVDHEAGEHHSPQPLVALARPGHGATRSRRARRSATR